MERVPRSTSPSPRPRAPPPQPRANLLTRKSTFMTVIYSRRCYRYILIDTFSNSHGTFLRARQRVVSAKHAVWIASSLWLWLSSPPFSSTTAYSTALSDLHLVHRTHTYHCPRHILPFDLFIVPRVDLPSKVLAVLFNVWYRRGGKVS